MKSSIKFSFLLIILSIFIHTVNAQTSVNINTYGTFLVENGKVRELHLVFSKKLGAFFWEQYIIIMDTTSIIMNTTFSYIYNKDTDVSSDPIAGDIIQLERGNHLRAYIRIGKNGTYYHNLNPGEYCIFEYDPDTLELKTKIPLSKYPFPEPERTSFLFDFEEKIHFQPTIKEKVNDRIYRYRGENFYLDVHFEHKDSNFDLFVHGGKDNIFVVNYWRRY